MGEKKASFTVKLLLGLQGLAFKKGREEKKVMLDSQLFFPLLSNYFLIRQGAGAREGEAVGPSVSSSFSLCALFS